MEDSATDVPKGFVQLGDSSLDVCRAARCYLDRRGLEEGSGEVRAAPLTEPRFSHTTIAGALLGLVALVVALTVGFTDIRDVPRFPSLRQSPDITIAGSIAFIRADADRRYVYVTAAGGVGVERKLLCEAEHR